MRCDYIHRNLLLNKINSIFPCADAIEFKRMVPFTIFQNDHMPFSVLFRKTQEGLLIFQVGIRRDPQ